MNEEMTRICGYLSDRFDLGAEIVSLLQAQCMDGLGIVICPDHLGDTFWAASFSGELKRQYGYKRILYACKGAHEEMLKLFPDIDLTMVLEQDEMDAVQTFFYMQQKNRAGDVFFSGFPFNIVIHYPTIQQVQVIPDGGGSLNSTFEKILGLSSPTEKSHVSFLPDGNEEERERTYRHAVLLSTGAYSVRPLPEAFWRKLAERIRARGYEVYVNDGDPGCDKRIDGAKPLSVSVPELVRIAPHLALFVGIRSGLCDILCQTPVKMKVIFSEAHERKTLEVTERDMWTHNVYEMDRTEGIEALQYVEELEDLLIYKILEALE